MTTILIKKKDTAGAPVAGDLTNAAGGAEIAVNTATKRIYSKDSGGTIIEMGTFPSSMAVQGALSATGATNLNGNVTLGDATADTLTVNALVNSNLLFTDGTYTIGANGANRPKELWLATSGGAPVAINALNTSSGGGQFQVNLFGSATGNAVTGDVLIQNGVGNMIISPNAANKKIVFVTGSWTNTPTMTIDSTNVLINTQTNYTASPNLYVYGGPGTLMTVGGLNHFSTSAGSNNNGFIGGAYYNTSSALIATHTSSAQYQNASGEHIFYTNTGLTVGNTYTNVRRFSVVGDGTTIVGPLTASRTNFFGTLTPFLQIEGSSATNIRAASLTYNSNASTGPLFVFSKSRGTAVGSVTAVQNTDELGQLNWTGLDGTGPILGASITAYVEGSVSTNNVPMKLSFQTGGTAAAIYSRYEISAAGSHYWKNITNNTYGTEMSLTPTLLTTYNKTIECQSNASAGFDAFQIYGTGYSSNQKYYRSKTADGVLKYQMMSDDYATERSWLEVYRSGVNPTEIYFKTGSSSATRLWISDSNGGQVNVGYAGSVSSDCRFLVSNAGNIGFEVAPGTVGGYTNDIRLLAYDRTGGSYKNLRYSAAIHIFNVSGTNDLMQVSAGNVLINNSTTVVSYGGELQVYRDANGSAKAITTFETNNPASSEDFNLSATSSTYTNSSTTGWGQQRILAARTASSVFNFLTCTASNDTKFYLRGDGNAYADGTWNNNGADYAEYFESASGVEIPVGTSVALDGNKVRPATAQDTQILGVVRPKQDGINSMMVGNTAWGNWSGKFLQDDFGCFIMEDFSVVEWTEILDEWAKEPDPAMGTEGVKKTKSHSYVIDEVPAGITVPADAVIKTHDSDGVKLERRKVNPAWNPDEKYTSREKRPEWLIIGLLGQIRILKGQPTGSNWVKMRDISDRVEEWFVK